MVMGSCKEWYPFLGMVTVDLALATVNILLKAVLNQLGTNQLLIVIYRQSISAIFLAPIAYLVERKERPKLTGNILCHLFFSALFGAALTQYFFLIGLQYTSATFTCAFINMVPVNTFLMAMPFRIENVDIKSKSGKAKLLGTLISVAGALVLTLYKGSPLPSHHTSNQVIEVAKTTTKRWGIGSMFLGAGSLMWSSWFLIQARISKSYPCQYSTTAFMSLISAVQTIILRFIVDGRKSDCIWILKGKFVILSVIYAGVVGSGLCYVVMSWCVKRRGPVFTAAFSPFIQAFVAIFDIFILQEQLYFGSVLGSILVIIGMYTLLWGKSLELNNSMTKQAPVLDNRDP